MNDNLKSTPPADVSMPEEDKATNIPDGEGDWTMGKENYTRKEVFKMLYTQRAMIYNDLKVYCMKDLTPDIIDVLEHPRKPKF